MTDTPRPQDAARLLVQLHRHQHAAHQTVPGQTLDPHIALLRTWQSQRLSRTHADLLASPRYNLACRFFLEEVYAPRDFSQRDADAQRMHDFMLRFLPARLLHTLTLTLELNTFTRELDDALLHAMVDTLGMTDTITADLYAEGYRVCNNYAARARQIDMIVEVGQGLERLVKLPFIGLTLQLARGPAQRAGWQDLQTYLERGFAAFKHMRGAHEFLDTIQRREMRILDRIFARTPDPFAV